MSITPDQFVARLGYAELLLFSNEYSDSPEFLGMTPKNIIRAKEYDLMPKFESNLDEDVIYGLPERALFGVTPVKIEGNIKLDVAATMYNRIEYPTAMMFDKLRQSWVGWGTSGAIMSERDDLKGTSSPLFSLGSATHGSFIQCLIDKFDFSAQNSDDPIDITFGIKSINHSPGYQRTLKAWDDVIYGTTNKYLTSTRRPVMCKDCTVEAGSNNVIGFFGIPNTSNSVFADGPNNPASTTQYITSINLSVENNLQPIYTCRSHEEEDLSKRFAENIFPDSYAMSSPRKVTGTMEWFENIKPHSFFERITGPTSNQNNKSLIINTKAFKIELKEPIWSLSEKRINLTLVKRTARFSVGSDGGIIISGYTTDYS